jgi:hypothetical protein
MTRLEIIAELDAELERLERARDYLTAALQGLKNRFPHPVGIKVPRKSRKQPAVVSVEVATISPQPEAALAEPPAAQSTEPTEPQIHRVPPRRRVERRGAQQDKPGRSPAALSGQVPAGPVAVSANEARKIQERAVPGPAAPAVTELRSEIGSERSLGSLIQAFERRIGSAGAETP